MSCLTCGMWDLIPRSGVEPWFPALGTWSVSPWTTREICRRLFLGVCVSFKGLSWWLSGKESAWSAGDSRDANSIPGSGRSPGKGTGNPFQCSCLGNPWTEEPGGLQSMRSQRVGHATEHDQHPRAPLRDFPIRPFAILQLVLLKDVWAIWWLYTDISAWHKLRRGTARS